MIQPFFIRITDNQLLNLHAVVGANYSPPIPGPGYEDEDGEQVKPRGARLKLVIEATNLETVEYFDGELKAFAATSQVIRLTGDDADRVWALLQTFELKPLGPKTEMPDWNDMTAEQRRSYTAIE